MYQIHDIVMHPSAGVCEVKDIRTEKFGATAENYYVLLPLYSAVQTTIYVPVATDKVPLRLLLTKPEIDAMLLKVKTLPSVWVEDAAERSAAFAAILKTQDHPTIIKMIAELYQDRARKQAQNKKPRQSDENLLSQAQHMIHQEFAYALGLDEAQTITYIMEKAELA